MPYSGSFLASDSCETGCYLPLISVSMSLQNLNIVDSTIQWVIILSAKGNHLMARCALTLAMKLLSRKMLAGPASMVYGELFLALACRKEWGESRGTEI